MGKPLEVGGSFGIGGEYRVRVEREIGGADGVTEVFAIGGKHEVGGADEGGGICTTGEVIPGRLADGADDLDSPNPIIRLSMSSSAIDCDDLRTGLSFNPKIAILAFSPMCASLITPHFWAHSSTFNGSTPILVIEHTPSSHCIFFDVLIPPTTASNGFSISDSFAITPNKYFDC